jgi:hypothetical protein
VEAVQSHPTCFLRNSHNQSVKLEFVVRSATGYGFAQQPHKARVDSGQSKRISLIRLRPCLAARLDGSSALPHHLYPKPITLTNRNQDQRRWVTQLPFPLSHPHRELDFQEKNISAWQKN